MPKPSVGPAPGPAPGFPAYETGVFLARRSWRILEPTARVALALSPYRGEGLLLSDVGGVGTVGIEPTSRSRRDRGLPLTYAPSGSGDWHAALPALRAGGTLSSLEPGRILGRPAGLAPAPAEPQSAMLLLQHGHRLVGPEGVAPSSPAYRAGALLMSYEPEVWCGRRASHPRSPPWQGGVLLARPRPHEKLGPMDSNHHDEFQRLAACR